MNFYEKEAAEEQKTRIWREQGCRCYVCGKMLPLMEAQAAHRIYKAKWMIKKYGPKVVHHRFNLRITCAKCNDAVLIMPESVEAQELIKAIMEDLKNESD